MGRRGRSCRHDGLFRRRGRDLAARRRSRVSELARNDLAREPRTRRTRPVRTGQRLQLRCVGLAVAPARIERSRRNLDRPRLPCNPGQDRAFHAETRLRRGVPAGRQRRLAHRSRQRHHPGRDDRRRTRAGSRRPRRPRERGCRRWPRVPVRILRIGQPDPRVPLHRRRRDLERARRDSATLLLPRRRRHLAARSRTRLLRQHRHVAIHRWRPDLHPGQQLVRVLRRSREQAARRHQPDRGVSGRERQRSAADRDRRRPLRIHRRRTERREPVPARPAPGAVLLELHAPRRAAFDRDRRTGPGLPARGIADDRPARRGPGHQRRLRTSRQFRRHHRLDELPDLHPARPGPEPDRPAAAELGLRRRRPHRDGVHGAARGRSARPACDLARRRRFGGRQEPPDPPELERFRGTGDDQRGRGQFRLRRHDHRDRILAAGRRCPLRHGQGARQCPRVAVLPFARWRCDLDRDRRPVAAGPLLLRPGHPRRPGAPRHRVRVRQRLFRSRRVRLDRQRRDVHRHGRRPARDPRPQPRDLAGWRAAVRRDRGRTVPL